MSMLLPIKPPIVQKSKELRSNPHNNVVRVGVNPEHGEALRLHLEPMFKLTCVTTLLVAGVNCSFTMRLCKSYGQAIKVDCRGRNSHALINRCLSTQLINVTSNQHHTWPVDSWEPRVGKKCLGNDVSSWQSNWLQLLLDEESPIEPRNQSEVTKTYILFQEVGVCES
jgi:hypothetical protein